MVLNNSVLTNKANITFLVSFLLSCQVSAQQISQNNFFDLSLEELMQVDVTIATKTPVKVNDVPGMISLIKSEDLEHQGLNTLWDALANLPGIQISIDSTGERLLVVRGIGKTYASGKVKFLLNGIAFNSTINAGATALMNIPVQQIQRIEVVRGPGSAVHGEFSYAGVINVITKKQGRGLYAVLGEDNSTRISGHYQWQNQQHDLSASVNFSTTQTEGADINSGLDAGSLLSVPVLGNSSGAVNNKRSMNSLLLNVDYGNVHTSLQWLEAKRGDHFGINDYLPPDERENRITNESLSFHSDVDVDLNPTLKLNMAFNWLESSVVKNKQFVGSALIFGAAATDPDVFSHVNVSEQRVELNVNLISTAFDKHVLFAELSKVKIDVDDAEQFLNLDPNTFIPSDTFFSFSSPVNSNQERNIESVTLQDEFFINPSLILTSGLRYDHYDFESSTTPRFALVYHASNQHSFRAQYAEAFRPPTLLEMNGSFSAQVSPEVIKTTEIGHQYQNDNTVFKSVLFYSKLSNLITFVNTEPFGFANTDKASLLGVEFEYEHRLNQHWQFESNVSLLKTEDKSTGNDIYGAANVLANAQINYHVNPKMSVKTNFNYVGKRAREQGDSRSELDDYLMTHIAVSVKQLANISGLSLHAGIKNVFNEDIRFQASADTYLNDYPVNNARSLWLQIDYKID